MIAELLSDLRQSKWYIVYSILENHFALIIGNTGVKRIYEQAISIVKIAVGVVYRALRFSDIISTFSIKHMIIRISSINRKLCARNNLAVLVNLINSGLGYAYKVVFKFEV